MFATHKMDKKCWLNLFIFDMYTFTLTTLLTTASMYHNNNILMYSYRCLKINKLPQSKYSGY